MSLACKHHVNYDRKLTDFYLPSLKRRRDVIDFKLHHSILSGKTRIQPTSFFNINTRISRRTNNLPISTQFVTPAVTYTLSMYELSTKIFTVFAKNI